MDSLADQLLGLSFADLRAKILGSEISVNDIAQAFVERINQSNSTLNAIVRFDDSWVLEQATELQLRLRRGETLPLLGIPFTVKDTLWIKGRKTTQGSNLYKEFVAPEDAASVARLKQAGALILGHSNTSEFACKGVTTNAIYGPTLNPWDLSTTPGGSSGGAAASVSAGLGFFALCTDGGGSTRRPAAHTGVVGFKPSRGLIPHPTGFKEPLFDNGVIGLMSRRVNDLPLLIDILHGVDPHDPDTAYEMRLDRKEVSIRGLRIAFSPKLGLDVPVDPGVAQAIQNVAAILEQEGAIVDIADPVWPGDAGDAAFSTLQCAGLAALYGEAFKSDPAQFDPDIAIQIEQGLGLSGAQVAAAYFQRSELYSSFAACFDRYDAILTPTTPCTAWAADQLGPSHIDGQPVTPRGHAVFTPQVNHTFQAAISIPCAVASNGLPIGAQIIVPRGKDYRALALAQLIETSVDYDFTQPHCIPM